MFFKLAIFSNSINQARFCLFRSVFRLVFTFCYQIGFIFVLSNDKLSLDVAFFKGEITYKR